MASRYLSDVRKVSTQWDTDLRRATASATYRRALRIKTLQGTAHRLRQDIEAKVRRELVTPLRSCSKTSAFKKLRGSAAEVRELVDRYAAEGQKVNRRVQRCAGS